VNAWKVILAALVIFAAGVVTGGLTIRLKLKDNPQPPPPANFGPLRQRGDLLDRMQRQLYLSSVQREHIEKILRESHDRMRQLWDSIAPQAQQEHRRVQELIRSELGPEQQKKFEEMLKSRGPNRPLDERRWHEERREGRGAHRPEGVSNPPARSEPPRRDRALQTP
jgi:hypothetical protein